jgi:hypothetical protein
MAERHNGTECPLHDVTFDGLNRRVDGLSEQNKEVLERLRKIEMTQEGKTSEMKVLHDQMTDQSKTNDGMWKAINGLRWHVWGAVGAISVLVPIIGALVGVFTKHLCDHLMQVPH